MDYSYEVEGMRAASRENEERLWQLEQRYPARETVAWANTSGVNTSEMNTSGAECKKNAIEIQQRDEGITAAGSLGLRLAVSILLLIGFLMLHLDGKAAFGFSTQRVVEAVRTDTGVAVGE